MPKQAQKPKHSTIPTKLTEEQFQKYVRPHRRCAKRGYESKIPLYKVFNYLLYVLYTGCQWPALQERIDQNDQGEAEISFQAVYYHFRKWSRDGSLQRVFEGSVRTIVADLDLSELNLDGSHTIAKKGAFGQVSRPKTG
jgi:transposase